MMTKGEHTYVRTGQTLYPLHNFVVRGDKYQDPSLSGSKDILFTRLFLYKMPMSEKEE